MPALTELLNPEEAERGVEFSEEVGCFEDIDPVSDAEPPDSKFPLTNDPFKVGEVEVVVLDDEAVMDGMVYPATA